MRQLYPGEEYVNTLRIQTPHTYCSTADIYPMPYAATTGPEPIYDNCYLLAPYPQPDAPRGDLICEYCGNESGLTDDRGQCISCGGSLSIKKEEKPVPWWKKNDVKIEYHTINDKYDWEDEFIIQESQKKWWQFWRR